MEVNKIVLGGVVLGCLGVAAAGGYFAGRQQPVAQSSPAVVAPLDANRPAAIDRPVQESEGVIAPEATVPPTAEAAAPVKSESAAVATRRESSTRSAAPRPATRTATVPPRAKAAPASPTPAEPVTRAEEPAPVAAPTTGGMWETRPTVTPERAPIIEPEPEAPAPPPAPEKVEIVVPAESVLGLQIERTVSSETARVEDRVEARVTRDVRVGDKVAIPAGALVQGSVSEVERGGKVKERARLSVRFHTVVLADGTRLNIRTDAVLREGSSPAKESAAKIGGAAIGGAILGAILGGSRGAVIGGTAGAAGGTAATMASERNPAVLSQGSTVTVRMQQAVTVVVEE